MSCRKCESMLSKYALLLYLLIYYRQMLVSYDQVTKWRPVKIVTQHHWEIEWIVKKMQNPREWVSQSGRPRKLSHSFEPTKGEVQKGEYDTMWMFEKEFKGKKQASVSLIKDREGKSELILQIEQRVSAELTEMYDVTFREKEPEKVVAIDRQDIKDPLPF